MIAAAAGSGRTPARMRSDSSTCRRIRGCSTTSRTLFDSSSRCRAARTRCRERQHARGPPGRLVHRVVRATRVRLRSRSIAGSGCRACCSTPCRTTPTTASPCSSSRRARSPCTRWRSRSRRATLEKAVLSDGARARRPVSSEGRVRSRALLSDAAAHGWRVRPRSPASTVMRWRGRRRGELRQARRARACDAAPGAAREAAERGHLDRGLGVHVSHAIASGRRVYLMSSDGAIEVNGIRAEAGERVLASAPGELQIRAVTPTEVFLVDLEA